jgi:hypothetical protein
MEILEHLLGVCGEGHMNLIHISLIVMAILYTTKVIWSTSLWK